jgi:hypothetical protein
VVFIGKAVAERANFIGYTESLIRLMLIDHTLISERLENSIYGRARNFQFVGEL